MTREEIIYIITSGDIRWDGHTRESIGFAEDLYNQLSPTEQEEIISLMLAIGHDEFCTIKYKGGK